MLAGNDETNQNKNNMTQKFFDALERRDRQFDELLQQNRKHFGELLEQNRHLISVIENMTGTTFKQSNVG